MMVKMRISAINPSRRSRYHGGLKGLQGFTLIELLVVLAILGLIIGLVPSSYQKLNESAQYRAALRGVVSELRSARQQALSKGAMSVFSIDLARRTYGVLGSTTRALPDTIDLVVTVGSLESTPREIASIEFAPEGGATGGTIDLVRHNGGGTRVRVDWLSGQVVLEHLP